MGLHNAVDKHKRLLLAALAVVLISASVVVTVRSLGRREQVSLPDRLWYLDLETNRLFADAVDLVPPFRNQAGHESVLAVVFSCKSDCAGKDLTGKTPEEVAQMGLQVGYLQRLTPSAREAVEEYKKTAPRPEHVMIQCMQRLVFEGEYREVNNPNWMPMRSQDFVKIGAALEARCPGTVQCKP